MEVSSPSFRIVDIEPRPSAQQIQVLLHGHADAVGLNPVPGLILATTTAADGTSASTALDTTAPVFAVPLTPACYEKQATVGKTITGKNIFSKPHVNEIPPPNLSKNTDQNVRNFHTIGNDPNMQKIPSGVQATQKDSIPLPTKKRSG
jgi:hypothetical protein